MLRIATNRAPTHPGEMLREEFLLPLGIPASEFAERIRVPAAVIEELIQEQAAITPDRALRLARALGTTAEFWLNGQLGWELYRALRAPEAADLPDIVPLLVASSEDT